MSFLASVENEKGGYSHLKGILKLARHSVQLLLKPALQTRFLQRHTADGQSDACTVHKQKVSVQIILKNSCVQDS